MPKTSDKKRCSRCRKLTPLNGFYKSKKAKDGLRSECKKCFSKKYKNTPDKNRLLRYGITVNEYHTMLLSQKNKCLICKEEKELLVDHCHETGIVRGLVCHLCNTGIGMLKDSTELLANALQYLIRATKTNS